MLLLIVVVVVGVVGVVVVVSVASQGMQTHLQHMQMLQNGSQNSYQNGATAGGGGSGVPYWPHQQPLLPYSQQGHGLYMPNLDTGHRRVRLAHDYNTFILHSTVGLVPSFFPAGSQTWQSQDPLLPPRHASIKKD